MTQPSSSEPRQPGARMRRIIASEPREPDLASPGRPRNFYTSSGFFGPTYWTIAGTLSVLVNIVLVIVLLVVVGKLKPAGLVNSLYGSFTAMSGATIRAEVPVQAQIPIDFSQPVKIETLITISRATTINNVPIILNTGGVDINAPASITLPAGTQLPIILDTSLLVKQSIPLSITVPVVIPIANTELAAPFQQLRSAFQPLYCLINPCP